MVDPFSEGKARNFSKSRAPAGDEEKEGWQAANKTWWESNPMRYDHRDGSISAAVHSPEFYDEVDRRFLQSVSVGFPWKKRPFDQFINFDKLQLQDILEVGVGCGTHAQLLAPIAHSYTGIDITEYAVETTQKRLDARSLHGRVIRMDAENMSFPDASFDFVWSWGVIHHSSDTQAVLREIHRVLKPGGEVCFMVYHESPWNTFVRGWLYYGLLKGGMFRGQSAHELLQSNTDGALARYYTTEDLRDEISGLFALSEIDYLGSKLQLLPLGYGTLKLLLAKLIPNRVGRWITNRQFFAYMLVATCKKLPLG
jgi:ubiquinone/menaquinone biosynthesis C-methylase UbiE